MGKDLFQLKGQEVEGASEAVTVMARVSKKGQSQRELRKPVRTHRAAGLVHREKQKPRGEGRC